MPKERTTAQSDIAALADSLGYTYTPLTGRFGDWWDARTVGGALVARLVVTEADGFEVYAFVGAGLIEWSATLTAGTPGAALAAVMAVAIAGPNR